MSNVDFTMLASLTPLIGAIIVFVLRVRFIQIRKRERDMEQIEKKTDELSDRISTIAERMRASRTSTERIPTSTEMQQRMLRDRSMAEFQTQIDRYNAQIEQTRRATDAYSRMSAEAMNMAHGYISEAPIPTYPPYPEIELPEVPRLLIPNPTSNYTTSLPGDFENHGTTRELKDKYQKAPSPKKEEEKREPKHRRIIIDKE